MALTKITQGVIKPDENYKTGIVTATHVDATTIGVAGTLTYEDVTSVDSIGIITARDGLDTPSGTDLVFRSSGTEVFRIDDSTKRIGIGVTDPQAEIHVYGSPSALFENSTGNNISVRTHVGNGNDAHINLDKSRGGAGTATTSLDGDSLGTFNFRGYTADGDYSQAAGIRGVQVGDAGSDFIGGRMLLRTTSTSGTERTAITIEPDQLVKIINNDLYVENNIGIGTTTPTAKLDVFDNDIQILIGDISEGTGPTDGGVRFNGIGTTIQSAIFTEVDGEILSYGINVRQITSGYSTDRVGGIFRLDTRTSGNFGDSNNFVVKGRSIGTTVEHNAMVINLDTGETSLSPDKGNVGIGTDDPLSILQVGAASTQAFYVFSDGRVGIGQTDPKGIIAARDNSGTSGFSQIMRAEKKGTSDTNVFRVDIDADANEIQLIGTGTQASNINIVSGNSVAYFATDGNVGIGSTQPTAKLDVDGGLNVSGIATLGTVEVSSGIITAATGIVTYYGDGSNLTGLGAGGVAPTENTTNQSQFIPFFTGTGSTTIAGISTQKFVFNPSTTRLGIGLTDPSSTLEINVGTATSALDIQGSAGQLFSVTNNLTSGSIFSVNDVSGIPSIDVDADGTIQLAPFGITEFVGVGKTNPTEKVDVVGNVKVSGLTTTQDLYVTGISTFRDDVSITYGSGIGLSITNEGDFSTADIVLNGHRNTGSPGNGVVGEIKFYNRTNNEYSNIQNLANGQFSFLHDGTNLLQIQETGNIGIGTDDPSAKLEVATSVDGEATLATFKNTSGGGTNETVDIKLGLENTVASNVILRAGKEGNHSSGSATDNFFAIHTTLDSTTSERLRITSDGKVGIGTDNPTESLHLAQNSDIAIRMDSNNANANARAWEIIVGGNASNNAEMVFRTRQDDGTGGSECARIKRNGTIALPSGGGIDFSATANSTGTVASEVFDNYEEGSYTPIASAGYTSPTYSTQAGYYTRVGNLLYVTGVLVLSGGTATGSGVQIGGMPFTSANPIGHGDAMVSVNGATNTASNQFIFGTISSGTTTIDLYHQTTTAIQTVAGTNLGNAVTIRFSATYRVQ